MQKKEDFYVSQSDFLLISKLKAGSHAFIKCNVNCDYMD